MYSTKHKTISKWASFAYMKLSLFYCLHDLIFTLNETLLGQIQTYTRKTMVILTVQPQQAMEHTAQPCHILAINSPPSATIHLRPETDNIQQAPIEYLHMYSLHAFFECVFTCMYSLHVFVYRLHQVRIENTNETIHLRMIAIRVGSNERKMSIPCNHSRMPRVWLYHEGKYRTSETTRILLPRTCSQQA